MAWQTKWIAWPEYTRAVEMLEAAELTPNAGDVEILQADIDAVANDYDGSSSAGAEELERRIGGLQNLASYMDCLRVSKWRKV
jgi:hypothetical protein